MKKVKVLSMLLAMLLTAGGTYFYTGAEECVSAMIEVTEESKATTDEVVRLVNEQRAMNKLGAYKTSPLLTELANIRAEELVEDFSHSRPDGTAGYDIVGDYGIFWMAAGENIAAGQSTAEGVVDSWMHSEGHRANILKEYYTHIGVGYYYSPDTKYKHYWVQIFYNLPDGMENEYIPGEEKEEVTGGIKADIDQDGEVTSSDALKILQMVVGQVEMDMNADIDQDGEVTSADALKLLQYVVGSVSEI